MSLNYFKTDIQRHHTVGERSQRNEINPSRGNVADRFERHATARLKHRRRPFAAHRHRFAQIVEAHVIEQDVDLG